MIMEWCAEERFGDLLTWANWVIGFCYIAIPVTIAIYLYKAGVVQYRWLYLLFLGFILGCGLSHIGHNLLLIDPQFWYFPSTVAHVGTALLSVGATVGVIKIMPLILRLPSHGEWQAMVAERDHLLELLGERQEELVRELNHRVRNNLQVLESMATLMIADAATKKMDPVDLLKNFLGRLKAVSRVHDRIYTNGEKVNTNDVIRGICNDLKSHFDADIEAVVDNLDIHIDQSTPLGQITNELVTNAVKYGKVNGGIPIVKVSFTVRDNQTWTLCVKDHGPGIPSNIERSKSFGMRLIRSLTRQLNARLVIANDETGASVCVIKEEEKPYAA